MNTLRSRLLAAILLLWSCHSIVAQDRSFGVRFGYGSGISFRQKLSEGNALEGLLTSRWGGAALTGLYQRERAVNGSENWHWYYGIGLHCGVHRRSNRRPPEFERMAERHINVGFDVVAGAVYQFQDLPLQFSLDFKPTISFTTQEWVPESFALSLRYVL